MNRQMFKQNNSIILSHLKINWKLILFFTLFWLIISIVVLSMTLWSHVEGGKVPVIGDYIFESRVINAHGSNASFSHSSSVVSISQMLNWALFSAPAIIFFSIFTILLINKTIIKEINNSQITCWLSLPLSRKQILSSKILYIVFANFIVFIPSYILILIFAGISYDASQWFGYVVLYGLQFILFIFLLIMIYTLISITIFERTAVLNILNSLIAFWILATWIMQLIYDMNPLEYQGLKYIQYVSLQSLIVCSIKFSQIDQVKSVVTQISSNTTLTVKFFRHIEINKIAISLCTLVMPITTVSGILLNNCLFKRKDLHI